jgi:biopolymer transport protein ExbD
MAGGASTDADDAITGINVTPLVDITLVLLIIFMVTAKLIASQGLPLVLPSAVNGGPLQEGFSIILAEDGSTQVDSRPVPSDDAIVALAGHALARNADMRTIIKADGAVPHRRVIHVLDLLRQAGVSRIAFGVTPLPPPAHAPRTPDDGPANEPR